MSRSIPLDIEGEIMKRLPVKSLIRFISVCKAWESLIKCSEFVAGYNGGTQRHHLFIEYKIEGELKLKYDCIVDDDDTFPQQKFAPTVPPIFQLLDNFNIIGSSGGLLCSAGSLKEPDNSKTNMILLWNPTIRKLITVAEPVNVVPWPSYYQIGFGVCPYTNDPKLVKITCIDLWRPHKIQSVSCIPNQVMVFTLSSGEWRPSFSNQLPRKSVEFWGFNTVIGQFIYWFARDWKDVDNKIINLIMSFDMSTEEFRGVALPDSLAYMDVPDLSVCRLRESLAVVDYYYVENKRVCHVWLMEDGDSKAFTKLFTINVPNASVLQTLGFRKSGEPIIEIFQDDDDDTTPSALVVYEPCSQHIRDLGISRKKHSFYGSSYMESLLLLDHDDDGHIVRCVKM